MECRNAYTAMRHVHNIVIENDFQNTGLQIAVGMKSSSGIVKSDFQKKILSQN